MGTRKRVLQMCEWSKDDGLSAELLISIGAGCVHVIENEKRPRNPNQHYDRRASYRCKTNRIKVMLVNGTVHIVNYRVMSADKTWIRDLSALSGKVLGAGTSNPFNKLRY